MNARRKTVLHWLILTFLLSVLSTCQQLERDEVEENIRRLKESDWGSNSEIIEAARILGERKDPRAVGPLIITLRNGNRAAQSAAAEALGKIGDRRAVPHLLALLWGEMKNEPKVAEALGRIGGEQSINGLVTGLLVAGEETGVEIAKALTELGWQPQNEVERVHYHVAGRNRVELEKDIGCLKRVILSDLRGARHSRKRKDILYFYKRSNEDFMVPILESVLLEWGDKDMALDYYNYGEPLREAATRWAERNGYTFIMTFK